MAVKFFGYNHVSSSGMKMEREGSMLEVLGVPDVLPAERTVDKLHLYFLKSKHGGGEVLKVLYPCLQPGQAFITFEEPEVAARVLQKRSHVLELQGQKYHLTVKAADRLEMDFPVEATVHLSMFPNEAEVRDILRSQGFVLTDLSSHQVRVNGFFLKLRAAKASLEPLLNTETKTDIMPSSLSPAPKVSPGAISKYYTDGNRSRPGSRNQAKSSNYHPASPEPNTPSSSRAGEESFVVDADVFGYAERLRKKDIDGILDSHDVRMEVRPLGDSCNISLQGKRARMAVCKLQSVMDDLSKSLRTQDVPLTDMNHGGMTLLETIQKNRNIYHSVLVCPQKDKLHLIGPSHESYELKRRLLGRPDDQPGRPGRTVDRNPCRRSSSLPPIRRRNTERDNGAVAHASPVGGAGYRPSKYHDDKHEGRVPKTEAAAPSGFVRRSSSESRHKAPAERTSVQNVENKQAPPKAPKKGLVQLLKFNTEDIKQKVKNLRK